jgi:hypothetical protein
VWWKPRLGIPAEFRQEFHIPVASGKFGRNRLGAGIFASLQAPFLPFPRPSGVLYSGNIPDYSGGIPASAVAPCFFLHSSLTQ